jgi:hypothetical protein
MPFVIKEARDLLVLFIKGPKVPKGPKNPRDLRDLATALNLRYPKDPRTQGT